MPRSEDPRRSADDDPSPTHEQPHEPAGTPDDDERVDTSQDDAGQEDQGRPDDPEKQRPDPGTGREGDDDAMSLTLAYSASRHREALTERSDRELLWAIRDQGDEAALDTLIKRKTGPLIQLAYRMVGDLEEARDIVQVTFFRLWEHRDRFDDRWSPNTWIYRICSNLSIDHIRARKSRDRLAEPVRLHLRDLAVGNADSDLSSLEEIEVLNIFQELACDLTEKQRLVFLLREVEDRSSKEVAEIVGCRESTVRNHLFNARKLLRAAVVKRYPEYAPRLGASAGQEAP